MEQPNVVFSHLDDLLQRIGNKIQIDDSKFESAETSYKTVAKWLEEDEAFFGKFKLSIYPHGSFRLNTTVKPIKNDEFDLDFVLQVDSAIQYYDPIFVLNQLERRLKQHGVYKDKISKHKRCIRINYENDFHMDIMPAFLSENQNYIKIPDRDLKSWVVSNPEGYAIWFEKQYIRGSYFLEKAASIKPLPDAVPYKILQPLQRSVQLIKRYRDIYFENESEEYLPKSIILSTLSALNYGFNTSDSESITCILKNISEKIIGNSFKPFNIENPVLKNEIFSSKWFKDIEIFIKFKKFIFDFNNDWTMMLTEKDIVKKYNYLNKFFGESISKTAVTEQANFMKSLKDKELLKIDKKIGMLTPFSSEKTLLHKRNNYFGD